MPNSFGMDLWHGSLIRLDFDISASLHQLVEGEGVAKHGLVHKHVRIDLGQMPTGVCCLSARL